MLLATWHNLSDVKHAEALDDQTHFAVLAASPPAS
jgi:hypothetical protein